MTSRLSWISIALACLAGGFGLRGHLSPQESSPVLAKASWPPHPSQIVNITNDVTGGQSLGMCVRKNSFLPLYSVPKDRWLVVTDLIVEEWNSDEAGYLFLIQEKGADFQIKLDNKFVGLAAPGPYHSPVGLTFEPGSTVGLWYPNRAGSDIFPKEILVEVSVTGYLTP